MTDVELQALATLVQTETAMMQAENQYRENCGHQVAYVDMTSHAFFRLQTELCRREALELSRDDFFFPVPEPEETGT